MLMIVRRLETLDLNLLVALDVLLQQGSVTRAAKQLGVSQPAVSQKLKRLREELDDPLFVPGSQGILPTPRALAIRAPLRRLLDELGQAVLGVPSFDPATSERRFVIAGSDLFEFAVLPNLLERLTEIAPHVRLSAVPRSVDLFDRLEHGTIDFVVGPSFLERPGIRRVKLTEDGFVVLARRGHPLMSGRLTLAKYLRAQHLVVSPGGRPGTFVDRALAEQGKSRTVAVQVSSFVAVPFIAARSDYFATVPSQLARHVTPLLDLESRKLPVAVPAVRSFLAWHERFEHDPGHRWFRELAKHWGD